jgi:N-acetylglucosaminyldiphosphoundecaprenol N-acetyl-beta-D-mannosaminyltransferase
MNTVNMFGINIHNITMGEAIQKIDGMIRTNKKGYIVTPNVDHVVKLQKDDEFRKVYGEASLILTDGMPIVWASRLAGNGIAERVAGSDLMPEMCRYAWVNGKRLFMLGAGPGVALKAAESLKEKYEGIIIDTYSPSYGFENNKEENDQIIHMINEAKPDILFVGVGAPKQEKWLYNNLNKLEVKVGVGVGASIDFIAGNIQRAPKWMQKCGLEWFYRFISEPGRLFRRYFIDDMAFIPLAMKEILYRRFYNTKALLYRRNMHVKKGVLVLHKGSRLFLKKTARIDLHGNLKMNSNSIGSNGRTSILRMENESKLIVNGNFSFYYGADIICFKGSQLTLGEGFINSDCKIRCHKYIEIGKGCAISHDVTIMDSDVHFLNGDNHTSAIKIGDHVWIGTKATILSGVTIGEGSVIAAGSVVNCDIPPFSLAGGVPARVIKESIRWEI